MQINEVCFNTFNGGRHPSDAPAQTQHAFFDEFQLAMLPSDPAASVGGREHVRSHH